MLCTLRHRARGFTLIELMIVVVVVSIIIAIAFPSYTEQVRKGRRADAKAALAELSQFMERTLVENKTYTPGGASPTLPFTESPKDGTSKYYTLSLRAVAATSYTLQAVPKNAQANDKCGTMTLNSLGVKTAALTSGCW